jgi:lysophospholipase L1-like esterase
MQHLADFDESGSSAETHRTRVEIGVRQRRQRFDLLVWSTLSFLDVGTLLGQAGQSVAISDPAFFFSPYNTFSDGPGPLQANNVREGSSYVLWNQAGSYLKVSFTGTSAVLVLDTSSITEGEMPKVKWSLDDGPMVTRQLARGQTALPLASKLKSGQHTLLFSLAAIDINEDRWKVPKEAIRIKALQLDAGSRVLPLSGPVTVRHKNAVFFGDSITEGAWLLGDSFQQSNGKYLDWVSRSDATLAWPATLAAALHTEYGNCGSGGTSWIRPMHPYRPPLTESWDWFFAGHSRLLSGKLTPTPDYVFVNLGTNDGANDTSAAVLPWLQAVRKAVAKQTLIFVLIPFGQQNRESLYRAVERSHDSKVKIVDLGPDWSKGLHHYGQPSLVSFDGLHPNLDASGLYACLLALKVQKLSN